MWRRAAIRVDDDLAPGQAGVTFGTAGYEAAGRIYEYSERLGSQLSGNDGIDYVFLDLIAKLAKLN